MKTTTLGYVAWGILAVVLTGVICLIVAFLNTDDSTPIQWGIATKFFIFGIPAFIWALRTIKNERKKFKENENAKSIIQDTSGTVQ